MGCLENATPCKTHYASDEFWQYDANTNECAPPPVVCTAYLLDTSASFPSG